MPFVEEQRESLFLFPPLLIRHLDCSAMPKAVSFYPYRYNWNSLFTHLAGPKKKYHPSLFPLGPFLFSIFFVLNDRKPHRVVYPIDLIMSKKKFFRPHISLENCIQEEDERKRNFEIPPQLLSSFPVSF